MGEVNLQNMPVKVQWRRLLVALARLVVLMSLFSFLTDWLIAAVPAHARAVKDGIGLITVLLVALFVIVPVLEACGIKTDKDSKQDVKDVYLVGVIGLTIGLMFALNEFRYILEIDKLPLYNRLYNIFIGVVGACGYGAYLYLKRRRDRRRTG